MSRLIATGCHTSQHLHSCSTFEAWTVQSAMVLFITFRKRRSRKALAGTSQTTPNGAIAVQGELPNGLSGKSDIRRENEEAIEHW
jgi:hypothetical protein